MIGTGRLALLFLLLPVLAYAQIDGHVSVMFDALPDISAAPDSQRVMELRTRLFIERKQDVGTNGTVLPAPPGVTDQAQRFSLCQWFNGGQP